MLRSIGARGPYQGPDSAFIRRIFRCICAPGGGGEGSGDFRHQPRSGVDESGMRLWTRQAPARFFSDCVGRARDAADADDGSSPRKAIWLRRRTTVVACALAARHWSSSRPAPGTGLPCPRGDTVVLVAITASMRCLRSNPAMASICSSSRSGRDFEREWRVFAVLVGELCLLGFQRTPSSWSSSASLQLAQVPGVGRGDVDRHVACMRAYTLRRHAR